MAGLIERIVPDLGTVIAKSAPLLASVLGSPLAGIAISLLASAFGVDKSKVKDLASIIYDHPDAEFKLKQLEAEHQEALAKIASVDYQTEVDDRKNARLNSPLYKDFLRHMAYLVTIGFFLALFSLFIPLSLGTEEKQLMSMLVGMLASKWQTIIDFFFGSSKHH